MTAPPSAPTVLARLGRPLALALALGVGALIPAPAPAQTTETPAAAEVAALAEALRLDDLFAVLRDEGVEHGRTLEADMFPSGGGPGWADDLSRLYDADRLRAVFLATLEGELRGDPALADILAFFTSDLGRRVVGLEIDARRAFIADEVEDAARVAADRRRMERDPRARQIDRFIEAGDLLEMNVAGALSGNLAFLSGMNESGVYGQGLPQDQLMEDVWGQEAQIRDDTRSWLQAYLGLAYETLSEDELDRYIAFWESDAGARLNAALFVAFDRVFRPLSHDLGRAAGLAMLGRDI
jgi:hypothetical protein